MRLLGPAVPVERFVAGTSASAGERLRLEVTRFTGVGLPSSLAVPRDAAWVSGTCLPYLATDGVLRCLPVTSRAKSPLPIVVGRRRTGSTYADAECTIPLVPEGAAITSRLDPSPACPRMVRAFRTGVPHTGDVHTGAPGACTPMPAGTSGYAQLGDEIPPGEFVPMTLE